MDNNTNYNQLNIEIDKLKAGDYTSYQKFYGLTAGYLYKIIIDNVKDQNVANSLINNLYKDIYTNIAAELTDNNKFFEWAGNKANTLSTTYILTHNEQAEDKGKKLEDAAAVIAANVGINSVKSTGITHAGITDGTNIGYASNGYGQVGIGSASSESGQAGIMQVSGSSNQTGVSQITGGVNQTGVSQITGGINQTGVSQITGSTNQTGVSQITGGATKVAKKGLTLGAKIAIGIVAGIATIGVIIGAVKAFEPDNKEKKDNANVTSEAVTNVTEEEDTTNITTEAVTEEAVIDEDAARSLAYLEVVKSCMKEYPCYISYNVDSFSNVSGLWSVQLIDFDGDEEDELLLAYTTGTVAEILNNKYVVDIYDYIDGEAVLVGSHYSEAESNTIIFEVYYAIENVDNGKCNLWVSQQSHLNNKFGDHIDKYICYEYSETGLSEIHNYVYTSEKNVDSAIDGETLDKESASHVIKEFKEADYDFYYNDQSGRGRCPINYAINKSLIVKHRTIKELAKLSGDESFTGKAKIPGSGLKVGDRNILSFINDTYNEHVELRDDYVKDNVIELGGTAEMSADGRSVHLKYNPEFLYSRIENLELDYYITFVEDVLIVVGGVDEYRILDESSSQYKEDVEYYFWFDVDAYLARNPYEDMAPYSAQSDYEVTQEEFNANANELMTR